MYIWHETLIFCHTFCMAAKAMRDPFYKIDWLTDSIKTKSWDNIHYCIIFEQNDIFFPLRSCFFYYGICLFVLHFIFCNLIWKFVWHLDLDLSKWRDKHCQKEFKWHFFHIKCFFFFTFSFAIWCLYNNEAYWSADSWPL